MRVRTANMKEPRRKQGCVVAALAVAAICIISCGVGYIWGWINQVGLQSRTIAFSLGDASWGNGNYKAYYGARVFYEPSEKPGQVDVMLEVDIGPWGDYKHTARKIGQAASADEAREKWRKIEWAKDALLVGEGADRYSLSRESLESHR
jgi:hypothetical protein